ncbi:hypothetical protein ACMD2_05066 [Ananas comosus]|uniref:Uncharacterized protein n=1 Tax=Ananas comosus TaxID=4615 RepID=A0A199W907_ANACO|nr:hypothetical protein ACMD2_05066 [Ananas comosus]
MWYARYIDELFLNKEASSTAQIHLNSSSISETNFSATNRPGSTGLKTLHLELSAVFSANPTSASEGQLKFLHASSHAFLITYD